MYLSNGSKPVILNNQCRNYFCFKGTPYDVMVFKYLEYANILSRVPCSSSSSHHLHFEGQSCIKRFSREYKRRGKNMLNMEAHYTLLPHTLSNSTSIIFHASQTGLHASWKTDHNDASFRRRNRLCLWTLKICPVDKNYSWLKKICCVKLIKSVPRNHS